MDDLYWTLSFDKSLNVPNPVLEGNIFGEGPPQEREVSRTVVGGCGMNLKGKKVELSDEAKMMFEEKWPELMGKESETWSMVESSNGQKKGAAFHLMIDQAPVESEGYEWMESLLQTEGESMEGLEQFYRAVNALAQKDLAAFKGVLDVMAPFSFSGWWSRNYYGEQTRDRMGRSLLHFSAQLEDISFSKEIVEKSPKLVSEGDVHGFLPIHYAAMEGNVLQIEYLRERDFSSVHRKSYSGMTPLMVAAQHGHLSAARALLKGGAKINEANAGGYTPLMMAVHEGNFEIAELLLKLDKIEVNRVTGRKVSALHLAAEIKDVRILELLLGRGGDPNQKDRAGSTPLNSAIQSGNVEGMKLLAPKTVYQKEIGMDLAKYGTKESVRALIGQWNSNAHLVEMIHLSLEQGNEAVYLALLDDLLKRGVEGKAEGARLLEKSDALARKKGGKLIEKLVETRIFFDRVQMILTLCIVGDTPFVREFLKKVHWDRAPEPETVMIQGLCNLLHYGNISLIPFYLECTKFDPYGKQFNQEGWGYPHYLAKLDAFMLLHQWFLKHDDPLCSLPEKGGPLTLPYIAAREGSQGTLHFLLEKMREKNIPLENHYGDKHLLVGAFESYDEKVILLVLSSCPDVDVPLNPSMERAAHLAARQNQVGVLKEIKRRGGDLTVREESEKTPLEMAIESGSIEAASYLIGLNIPIYSTDVEAIHNSPDREKILPLITSKPIISYEKTVSVPPLLTSALDEESLGTLLAAQTLRSKIEAAKNLPLEKMVPANEKTGLVYSLPLMFYLIQLATRAHPNDQQALTSLILDVSLSYPQLTDARGNSLSHMIALLDHVESFKKALNLKEKNVSGQTPLHIAALEGSEKTFTLLLDLADKADIEAVDQQGKTPLFYAILKNKVSAVRLLIDRGANVNHRDHRNVTPLITALRKKRPKTLLSLLNVSDVDQLIKVKDQETTPLEHLGASGDLKTFVHALECHPVSQTKAKRRRKMIPYLLAERGALEATRCMMQRHQTLYFEKVEGLYPWDIAAMRGHQLLVHYFWEEIPDLFEKFGKNLLRSAAVGGQRDTAAFLVEKGILNHLDEGQKKEVFGYAAASSCKETLHFFTALFHREKEENHLFRGVARAVSSGIVNRAAPSLPHLYEDVGFPSTIALDAQMPGLHLASLHGSIETVKYLANRPDVDFDQKDESDEEYTAIERAAEGESPVSLRYLLEKINPPVDQQNDDGQTLLHIAARNSRFQNNMLLLDRGYDPNIRDVWGLTPQEIAAIEGDFESLRLFLFLGADEESMRNIEKRGAEGAAKGDHLLKRYQEVLRLVAEFNQIFAQSEKGETPLHLAVRAQWKVALTLLARTGLLDIQNEKGWTPLHLAAALGYREVLRILVEQGADVEIRDAQGRTPLDLAKEYGHQEKTLFLGKLGRKRFRGCA